MSAEDYRKTIMINVTIQLLNTNPDVDRKYFITLLLIEMLQLGVFLYLDGCTVIHIPRLFPIRSSNKVAGRTIKPKDKHDKHGPECDLRVKLKDGSVSVVTFKYSLQIHLVLK